MAAGTDFSLSSFLAARLKNQGPGSFSSTVIRISRISIALGVAILFVSVVIYAGFEREIQTRMFSIGGHISLRQLTTGSLYEEVPLSTRDPFLDRLRKLPEVHKIQSFAFKPALMSNQKEVTGVVLKGIGPDFYLRAFEANLLGSDKALPGPGDIWLSETMSRQLEAGIGDELILFFLQDPPRYRKVRIRNLYKTGLEDADQHLAMVSLGLLQELNGWSDRQAGGFEVFVRDFQRFGPALRQVVEAMPYNLGAEPVTHSQAQLFEWLEVIGRNVLILFVLISMVAGFNMAATLLIMVVERRRMVGILKALGAGNSLIRLVFVRNGIRVVVQGLFWGNAIGLIFALVQDRFRLIPLDPANYYLSSVPIAWDWSGLLLINIGVLLITGLVLWIPVQMVNRFRPSEAVRL